MKEQLDKQLNEESKVAQEYRDHKPDIDWMYAKFNQIADEMRELKKWYYEEVAKDKNRNKNKNMTARHQYGLNNSSG